jgi:hypothetical protein
LDHFTVRFLGDELAQAGLTFPDREIYLVPGDVALTADDIISSGYPVTDYAPRLSYSEDGGHSYWPFESMRTLYRLQAHPNTWAGQYRIVVGSEYRNTYLISNQTFFFESGTLSDYYLPDVGDRFSKAGVIYEVTEAPLGYTRYAEAVAWDSDSQDLAMWEGAINEGLNPAFATLEDLTLTVEGQMQCAGPYGEYTYEITEIADDAFNSNWYKNIRIEDGVQTIGVCAFWNSPSIQSFSFGSDVRYIGEQAVTGCYQLTTIEVDEDNPYLDAIDDVLFANNKTQLICYPCAKEGTSYTVPASVKSIHTTALENTPLEEIILPEGLETIYLRAFNSKIESLNIPASVTDIQIGALFNAASLSTLTVDEDSTTYKAVDNVLFSKDGKTLICYPPGTSATSYRVPSGTEVIETFAFGTYAYDSNEKLETLVLPASVTTVNRQAFHSTNSLKTLRIEATEAPTLGTNPFGYAVPEDPTLQIYEESLASYEAAGWLNHFPNVEYITAEQTGSPGSGDLNGDGAVTPFEALEALRCASGTTGFSEAQIAAIDLDGNGTVTPYEALQILRMAAGG